MKYKPEIFIGMSLQRKTAPEHGPQAIQSLLKAISLNPFIAEPHVVLAQAYLRAEQWKEAETHSAQGLDLLTQWGTPWDKRMSFGGWVAWSRVMNMKAKENKYPKNSWEVINLGLTDAAKSK